MEINMMDESAFEDLKDRTEEAIEALQNLRSLDTELADGVADIDRVMDTLQERKEKLEELQSDLQDELRGFNRGY